MRLREFNHEKLILLLVLLYTVVFTYLSWVRYANLNAPTFDMGAFIQATYSSFNGTPIFTGSPVITAGAFGLNYLEVHFSPILYVISPFLHVFDPAATLFVIQWFFLGLGAIFVYRICLIETRNNNLSLVASLVYLLYPPTIMSAMYDFHELALFPVLFLGIYYGLITKRNGLAILCIVAGIMTQEAFMLILPFVAFQMIANEAYELGGITKILRVKRSHLVLYSVMIIVSLVLFYLVVFVIMRNLNPNRTNLITSSSGYGLGIQDLAVGLQYKAFYWVVLLGTLGFLPIIGIRKAFVYAPLFFLTLFTLHVNFSDLAFQYSLTATAGIFIAFIEGLKILNGRRNQPVKSHKTVASKIVKGKDKFVVILSVVVIINVAISPLLPLCQGIPTARPINTIEASANLTQLNGMLDEIPSNSVVLASDLIFPHIATYPNIYPIVYGSVNQTLLLYNYLPPGIIPQYIVIFPTDYQSASLMIHSFPQNYSVFASMMYTYTSYSGFYEEHQQTTMITIYKLNS